MPLYFSTNDAIFWKTLCFFVKYSGFNGLILGRMLLKSVPFSLANSCFKDTSKYRLASFSFRFSFAMSSAASFFYLSCAYSKNAAMMPAL